MDQDLSQLFITIIYHNKLLGTEVGLSPGDFVLDEDPARTPQKGGGALSPIFGPFYCGQTARCIKIPLGMKVGLSSGDFVSYGDPVPLPKKGAEPPIFGPYLLWPNGWMDQDGTWYGGRPQPMGLCVRCGPSPPPQKGG